MSKYRTNNSLVPNQKQMKYHEFKPYKTILKILKIPKKMTKF